jgi:membrane fusion protein (multidrug efflux system)
VSLGESVVSEGALRVRPGQEVKVAEQLRQISEFAP